MTDRTTALQRRGLIDNQGRITEAGELHAELTRQARDGQLDAPAEFDEPGPTGHGWAPNPYPGGGLI